MPVVFNPFTGNLDLIDNTAAAGSDTQVQFNDGGVLGGDSGLVFNKTTNALTGGAFIPTSSTVPTNGVYLPAANSVALSTNGTGRLFVSNTGEISTSQGGFISIPDGVGSGFTPQIFSSKTSGVAGLGVYVADGTNNRRAGLFVDQTNAIWGLSSLWSTGQPDFVIRAATNERLRITSTGQLSHIGGGSSASPAVGFNGSAPSNSLVIDSTGKVGIGTSNPQAELHINDVAGLARLRFTGGATGADNFEIGQAIVGVSNSGFSIYDVDEAATRFVIDSSGNVGIGTTSPNQLLSIAGSSANILLAGTSNSYTTYNINASNVGYVGDANWIFGGSSSDFGIRATSNLVFGIGATERARIDSSGTFRVKGAGTAGVNDAVQLNGSAPANSLLLDASGRLLVGTSSARTNGYLGAGQQQLESSNAFAAFQITGNQNGVSGAYLGLWKSRGTSAGSNTIVQSDDILGGIYFGGSDGTKQVASALIESEVDGTPGANDMPGRLVFSVTRNGSSSPTEAIRIANDGRSNFFADSNVVQMVATAKAASIADYLLIGRHSSTGYNTGTSCIVILSNGNINNTNNSYGAISDLKLKENIVDAASQWSDIKALQVRNYNFKEGQTHTQIGLVAQEVELVSPGLVSESPDRDEDGNDLGTVTKSVNYSVLYMKAVKALQEAMERIETLEASNADLLARVSALESA